MDRALLFGLGWALLACGEPNTGSAVNGSGSEVGVSHFGGAPTAETTVGAGFGGEGASAAENPSSDGPAAAAGGGSNDDDHGADDHSSDDHGADDHGADDHSGDDHSGDDHGGDDHGGNDHSGDGDGGAGSAGGASSAESAATMADVQAIFDDRCVQCHDPTLAGLPGYPQLPLIEGSANAALVNKPGLETCGGTLVVPGDPDQSYLMRKLSDTEPCEGARMPRTFGLGVAPPLTSAELATIRAWISAGAKP